VLWGCIGRKSLIKEKQLRRWVMKTPDCLTVTALGVENSECGSVTLKWSDMQESHYVEGDREDYHWLG
jgi:hypothetical protein